MAAVWWVMFWGSLAITAAMLALGLLVALRPRGRAAPGIVGRWIIGGGVVFPGAVLIALMVYGFGPGRGALPQAPPDDAYRVEVVAHQWWWEVRYPEAPGGPLVDANEIHVPAGRPVHIALTSADVIHSFWVPRLGGKIDAIPGHRNDLQLQADAPGLYRGQCAEFCGAQHARMGFVLEAHEPEALAARLERLAAGAPAPADPDGAGAALYRQHCVACHSLDPRQASPVPGPSLAGLQHRHRLGAGWFPNDRDSRRRWLSEHQTMKPGNRMPAFDHLGAPALDAIASFLEGSP